jgi:hypothetical protein
VPRGQKATMTSSASRDFDAGAASEAVAGRLPSSADWPRALRGARRRRRDAPAGSRIGLAQVDATGNSISLLDAEPDLGRGIEAKDWELARRATRATLRRIERRDLALLAAASDSGNIIGLIVNDGMISREIALGEHVVFELLIPGDVLLLAAAGSDDLDVAGGVTLTPLNAAEVIVLSKPFSHAAARWPSLLANLHRRLEGQRRRLAIQSLAAHLPRAEDRLLLTLWMLAASCGRVTPDGTLLPLSLSHEALGRLAAARRPTITLALRNLEGAECVERRPDGHLILRPAAQRRVRELTHAGTRLLPIGPSVAPRKPVQPPARPSPTAQKVALP